MRRRRRGTEVQTTVGAHAEPLPRRTLDDVGRDGWQIREATYAFKRTVCGAFDAGHSVEEIAEQLADRETDYWAEAVAEVRDALVVYGRLEGALAAVSPAGDAELALSVLRKIAVDPTVWTIHHSPAPPDGSGLILVCLESTWIPVTEGEADLLRRLVTG